ncbi:MAG: hypothetical protein J1F61_05550 [Clostridiales bacterium]|nr:hypothetical protein [Clostridiales bacterium]
MRKSEKAVKSENETALRGRRNSNTVTSNRLEMLITVVSRNKAEYYVDLMQSFEINMQIVTHATGTANERMLSLLGLTDSEKVVIFSVIQQNKIPNAMSVLEEKFKTIKGGKGIAFTVPLTSVIGKLIFGFLSNNKMTVQEGK